jgi:hypothetical protein
MVPVLTYNLPQPVADNQELLTLVVVVEVDTIQVVVLHKAVTAGQESSLSGINTA